MLISCVMIAAVMSVAISSKQSSVHQQRQLRFNQGIAQLSSMLKGYVTACGCNPQTGICPPPACTGILGPNTTNLGTNPANTWYLNSDNLANNTIQDNQGDKWALMCGIHKITGVMNSGVNLEIPPYNGAISYNVTWPNGNCGSGAIPGPNDVPTVVFTANWTEP